MRNLDDSSENSDDDYDDFDTEEDEDDDNIPLTAQETEKWDRYPHSIDFKEWTRKAGC